MARAHSRAALHVQEGARVRCADRGGVKEGHTNPEAWLGVGCGGGRGLGHTTGAHLSGVTARALAGGGPAAVRHRQVGGRHDQPAVFVHGCAAPGLVPAREPRARQPSPPPAAAMDSPRARGPTACL
eukprot:4971339-Prymnesium_polylepis.1